MHSDSATFFSVRDICLSFFLLYHRGRVGAAGEGAGLEGCCRDGVARIVRLQMRDKQRFDSHQTGIFSGILVK